MKKIVGLLLLVCLYTGAYAKFVNVGDAKNVAFHYMQTVSNIENADVLQLIYTGSSELDGAHVTDFYVFGLQGATGFVMIAADDNIVPVLAYSTDNNFNATHIPDNVANWLQGYKMQINDVIHRNYVAGEAVKAQWSGLVTGVNLHIAAKTTYGQVGPLFGILWGQQTFYDSLCPYDYNAGARTITGCVATAMAQVMRYWKWPATGTDSNSYYPPNSSLGLQSVNYTQQHYMWDSMPYNLSKNNFHVANLMYSCGVSVNMQYGVTESGSYVTNSQYPGYNTAEHALPTYFRYSNTIHGEDRANYTDSQWIQMIYNELVARRPIIYSGYGSVGGHCFVLNGCDKSYRFYFNWGWTGNSNGYYTLDALNPGGMDFNSSHSAIFSIYPDTMAPARIQPIAVNSVQDIVVSPNPANKLLQIQATNSIDQIVIIDLNGKIWMDEKQSVPLKFASINTAALPVGIYTLKTICEGHATLQKIVIAR